MKNSSNLNISCKVVFSLNKWNKKVGSPSSFRRKRPFISLNSSASIENLSRSERARARARANHAINDAQKGCAMQLNGITLRTFARKTSTTQIFFILWLQSDNELPMSEMEKNWGVTDFVFEIKRVKNYPNFDKSALVTRYGLSAC